MTRLGLAVVAVAALLSLAGLALAIPQSEVACARGYLPCLPVKADLDCGQIPDVKKPVRVTGADPYGLDADRDGLGCEVSGEGGGGQSPWGLILRTPPRREATSAKVGDVLTVVGWSPSAMKGEDYALCVTRTNGSSCEGSNRYVLNGKVQRFGTWKIARGEGRRGVFKLSLQVKGRTRVSDTVPLR